MFLTNVLLYSLCDLSSHETCPLKKKIDNVLTTIQLLDLNLDQLYLAKFNLATKEFK